MVERITRIKTNYTNSEVQKSKKFETNPPNPLSILYRLTHRLYELLQVCLGLRWNMFDGGGWFNTVWRNCLGWSLTYSFFYCYGNRIPGFFIAKRIFLLHDDLCRCYNSSEFS